MAGGSADDDSNSVTEISAWSRRIDTLCAPIRRFHSDRSEIRVGVGRYEREVSFGFTKGALAA
ncbi:hypothetical protein Halar_3096 [halophilic archaeon DL31]|jgi:hypothetical protein|nr:hypothetical protein Halar_3096 [halophilic archaeon DL31]